MDNKQPVFIETPEGIKEVKEPETKVEMNGEFTEDEFLVQPRIAIFKAVIIDDKFIEEYLKQAREIVDHDYELVVYKDEFTVQTISYTAPHESDEEGKVEESITLDSYTSIENSEYKEENDNHITLHRGDKIARYNGQYNRISDGVHVTDKVREAINTIKGE